MPARTLVIKVTAGKDEPERSGQALNVAAAALASGVAVSLWLTGEASWFALPGRAAEVVLDHSPPLSDLFASVLAGGTGFRYELAREYGLHVGLDVAFSRDTTAIYLQIGSAWGGL